MRTPSRSIRSSLASLRSCTTNSLKAKESGNRFDRIWHRYGVAERWEESRWGDLVSFEYGSPVTAYAANGPYPVYGTNGPFERTGEYIDQGPSVIIGRKGAYRGVHFAPGPFWAVDTGFFIRPRVEFDMRWAYYSLLTQDIKGLDSGSAIPSTSRDSLIRLPVLVPPIEEQRAIASVLGALDDKIELNRRMNETLEALARAIFTSWFVDFDLVRARAEGRQPANMDAETAALFPDSFEDSPLGPIPSGWHAGELGDVVSMNIRSRLPEYPHREIKYVDIASVTRGRLEAAAPMPLDAAPSRARRLVKDGDVIWSCVRPNRRSYLRIDHPPDNLVVSTGFVVLTPTVVPSSYLYLSVTTDEFVDYLTANADGSAYPAVRPENFDRSPMLIPENPPLRAFDDRVLPMLRRMAANERENNTLAVIRDSLLPKLVSGDIRIGPGAIPKARVTSSMRLASSGDGPSSYGGA